MESSLFAALAERPAWLNAATVVVLMLEGAGVPGVPGLPIMLAQAAMIGSGHTTLAAALFWGVLGGSVGSLGGYAVGRWGRHWLPQRWQAALEGEGARGWLEHWGGLAILVSRWFGTLRTPVTLGAGASKLPFGRYAVWSFLGELTHVTVWQTGLVHFGRQAIAVWERGQHTLLLALAALVLLVLAVLAWRRQVRKRAQARLLARGSVEGSRER